MKRTILITDINRTNFKSLVSNEFIDNQNILKQIYNKSKTIVINHLINTSKCKHTILNFNVGNSSDDSLSLLIITNLKLNYYVSFALCIKQYINSINKSNLILSKKKIDSLSILGLFSFCNLYNLDIEIMVDILIHSFDTFENRTFDINEELDTIIIYDIPVPVIYDEE